MKNKNEGHFSRLKQKYLNKGIEAFTEEEVLELILKFGNFRKDTKDLARMLLKKYKSLDKVIDAPLDELTKIKGLGVNSLMPLKILPDIAKLYVKTKTFTQKHQFDSPKKIIEYLKSYYKNRDIEILKVIYLDNGLNFLAESNYEGTVDTIFPYPRNIIKKAFDIGASNIILIHNHPGGTIAPGKEDKAFTKELILVASKLDISILDHIIIKDDKYFSFAENNLIKGFSQNIDYLLQEIKRLGEYD